MISMTTPGRRDLILNDHLSLADANGIIRGAVTITLHPGAVTRCAASHRRLRQVIDENRHVYGITTGFGPLANRLVSKTDGALLQQNLVYHLASGVGPRFDWASGRALVLARLMSVIQGASGASEVAINALVALLNSDLSPCVPSKGTVGASGDLTPLAHMVLCFQGQGVFCAADGQLFEGSDGLMRLGIDALDLDRRDGLALVNGTSAMTGLAVLNADTAGRLVKWAIVLTAALAEVLNGRAEAWHAAFSILRPHTRQSDTARMLLARLGDSQRVIWSPLAARRLSDLDKMTEAEAGQDAYTLRCAPQVIGAVWDTLDWHNQVVGTELNAVTDNPIFPESQDGSLVVLHGGNFMGQHVGLASDALANAVCVLAGMAERQIARLTDEKLNRGLPAFLHMGPAGLNSGFMGAQVTATALVAEMRAIGAGSTQSISTNGANQDVVSMGTIAARLVQDKLIGTSQILAILALALAQAIDLRNQDDDAVAFSADARRLHAFLREFAPCVSTDRSLGPEIERLAAAMGMHNPPGVECSPLSRRANC